MENIENILNITMDIWKIEGTIEYLHVACGTLKNISKSVPMFGKTEKEGEKTNNPKAKGLCGTKTWTCFETKKTRIAIIFHMAC